MKCLLLAMAVSIGTLASAVNLITNGSFENPVVNAPFSTVLAGSPTLSGWTVTGNSVDIVSQTFNPTYPARDGVQCIDLAGSPGPGMISQSFATVVNQQYIFGWSGSSNGSSQTMEVYLNGNFLFSFNTPSQGTWTDYSWAFTATSTTSSIGFGSPSTGFTGALVDRVFAEEVVPEPASLLALGAGLALVRRRKRAPN